MTITQRNNTLLFIIGILLVILIFLALVPYILYKNGEIESTFLTYKKYFTSANYIYGFSLILFSVVSLFILRQFFYKTNNTEIYFFMLFIISLTFEFSRPLILLVQELNLSFLYIMFLSRAAYFSKMLGVFALFVIAMASSDVGNNKFNTPLILIFILSFMFSSTIPLSDHALDNSYFMPGFFSYYFFTLLFIEFLVIIIFIINFFQKRNNEYLYLAISTLFIALGREITFYMVSIEYFCAGMIFMIAGTILFSNKLRDIYKWY